jgi:hypothetical protein
VYRIIKSTQDTYITDRITGFTLRGTDANVGRAATLDLFKLYDETALSGVAEPIELSRLLVKFDTNKMRSMTGSLDIDTDSFKVKLVLTDVVGGQPVPSNFTVIVHPLSQSWDEGVGRDVARFTDIDVANWLTASTSVTFTPWNVSGAAAEGALNGLNIDIIGSGNLNDGAGFRTLFKTQTFTTGEEDLDVDVTDIISATLVGLIPDNGFRIAFSGSFEYSSSTLFVKRFAARHASDPAIRPKLIVTYDDSIIDNHDNFVFNTSGSLYIFNSVRGSTANFVSGAAALELTGSACMTLKIISGAISPVTSQSFSASYDVNQRMLGSTYVTGAYYSTFAVSSFDSRLQREIMTAGSATFHTIWGSRDGTVAYRTGSLVIKASDVSSKVMNDSQLNITLPNCRQAYSQSSRSRVRVNVYDSADMYRLPATKLPLKRVQLVFERMYWRIVDVYAGDVIIPFGDDDDSTRLSVDADGMYFDFFPDDLYIGRTFAFEFMIVDRGDLIIIDSNLPTFVIEQ